MLDVLRSMGCQGSSLQGNPRWLHSLSCVGYCLCWRYESNRLPHRSHRSSLVLGGPSCRDSVRERFAGSTFGHSGSTAALTSQHLRPMWLLSQLIQVIDATTRKTQFSGNQGSGAPATGAPSAPATGASSAPTATAPSASATSAFVAPAASASCAAAAMLVQLEGPQWKRHRLPPPLRQPLPANL